MTQETRELIFAVMDDLTDQSLLVVCHHLYNYKRRDEIFKFLIRNRMTGRELKSRLFAPAPHGFGGSPMALAKFVIAKLEKADQARAVIVGRDV